MNCNMWKTVPNTVPDLLSYENPHHWEVHVYPLDQRMLPLLFSLRDKKVLVHWYKLFKTLKGKKKKKKKEQHGKFSEYLGKGKGNLCLLLILGGKGGYLWKNYKDMQDY